MLRSMKVPSDSLKAAVMWKRMHAHCSSDSLAGSSTETQLACLLCCITHRLPAPVCVLFPVQTIVDNKLLCQQREQCFFVCRLCCWRLLSELKPHYIFRKAPRRVILEPHMLGWCRLSQGSGFSTVADHLVLQAADRSLLADKSAAQHH